MSFIGIEVPHSTARLFGEIDVPGDREPVSSMHITVVYIGSETSIDVLAEAVKATYAVTAMTRPFTVRASRVTCFPANPDYKDGHPIIARIESDPLHEFREALVAALDTAGVDYNKQFPVYKPHVTLSHAPEEIEEFRIPTIEWGAHEVVMWGGDNGDDRLTVTFPLALTPAETTAEMAQRVAARFTTEAAARAQPTIRV